MEVAQTSKLPLYLLFVSIIITTVCYLPGLSGQFVLDDFENIVHNEELNIDQIDTTSIIQAAFAHSTSLSGRPISMISFALNKYFFGAGAYSFKVTNLCIHLANGFLIFIFGYLLVLATNYQNKTTSLKIKPEWFALILCAIWLAHPINTTGVLYIVQRNDQSSYFF